MTQGSPQLFTAIYPPSPLFFFPFLRVLSVQQVQNDSLMHYEEKKKMLEIPD